LRKLDKYEVLGELGHGAMGVVYRAHDPIINRPVALKTITTSVSDDPELLQRFYREAQSAGGLQHPNIVTIYDMGEAAGVPYIAMELVEGENLDQVIGRRSPLPLTLKLAYAVQACRALDYAHKRGIVHRDIKPGNVMISKDGTVKVVDFGIARVLEASRTLTGMLIGTFAYMSPEQYHGEHADERSDVWSFGVLLYELLSYQRPFTGPTPASVMHNICSVDPAPLSSLVPECPKELEAVVFKMLRKSSRERYQSMEDVLLDLEPLCRTLQSQSIAGLLEQSQQLFDQERFAEARDLVRQALQVESGNQKARVLLEKANAELKRILNRPKVQQYVEKGQTLLAEGKLQEAKAAAEHALLLDSRFAPAQELERAVRKELDRIQLIAGWLESAKQHIAEGLLDAADNLLSKVLEAEPSSPQALTLQQQVLSEKAEREKARRLLEGLQRAHELWTLQNYDACLELLRELGREFPSEEEVSRLFETVREDQLGQQKRQSLLQGRNLLASGRHDDAIALLTDLQRQFPDDEEIPELLEEVLKDQLNQRRLHGLAEARSLLAANQFDSCIALLNTLRQSFPEEPEIPRLLDAARQNQTEQIRNRGILKAGKLLAERQHEECLAFLGELEREFPGDEEILAMQRVVREDQAEQEKQRSLEEARRLLSARLYDACSDLLAALEKRFPADAEILRLQNAVREDRATRRRLQGLEKARDLLASKDYEKSAALLASLQQEFPEDDETQRLFESARKEQAEQRKREGLAQVRGLLGARRYAECIALLTQLQSEFVGESAISKLLESARKEQAEQRKREGLAQARGLLGARHYTECIALLTQLQSEFAGESAISKLLESARKEQAEQRKREGLAQARGLLGARRYDESITLLGKLQADFPGESEISKLLAAAREDLAEQQKQQKLAEARSLLTAQSFEEALALLDNLATAHPKDSAITKLQVLAQHEQDKRSKGEKVQRELEALKKLMGEKRYPEVIARTKELLAEFPAEPNFIRLAEFATSRQAIIDKESLLQEKLAEVKAFCDTGRYEEAMAAAQNALKTFPANAELESLYQQSETQQKKRQVRQQIEQRIREIKVKINREELSDAVALAKRTLITHGPDTDLTHLLNSAQVELQARERKKLQEASVETIRARIEAGDLEGASGAMEEALKSETLDSFDPRVQELSERIKEAETAAAREPASCGPPSSPDLSKEYALLQAAPLPEGALPPEKAPAPPEPLPVKAPLSPGTNAAPDLTPSAPAPSGIDVPLLPETPPPEARPEIPWTSVRTSAADVEAQPLAQAASVPLWRKPAVLAILALAIFSALWVGRRTRSVRPPERPRIANPQPDPLELAQRQALNAANKKIAANDLDGATQELRQAAELNGPLTSEIEEKLAQVEESMRDAHLRELRHEEEVLWQRATGSVNESRYPEAEKDLKQVLGLPPGGVHRADAQRYLEKTIPQLKLRNSLLAKAQQSLAQGNFLAARRYADEVRQNGDNPEELVANIDQAEQAQLKQLENQFELLKQRDDDAAIQQLTALRLKFQALAEDGGPQSNEARTYVNSIPGAIDEIRARVDQKRAEAAFQRTVQRYLQAAGANDKNGLAAAREEFQLIVQNGGPHADKAQQYLTEIKKQLDTLNEPPPLPPLAAKEPAAPKEQPNPAAADEEAIRRMVRRFFESFEQRNADGLKQVWPSMPRDRYAKYKDSFRHVNAIAIQVMSEDVKISPDGATAQVSIQSQEQETPIGGKPQRFTPEWTFQLAKKNGSWVITGVL
jgi:serine/threonine protein kinase/anti-sigma28 factor (negative regulator of flagellin synthesis)